MNKDGAEMIIAAVLWILIVLGLFMSADSEKKLQLQIEQAVPME